MQKIGVLDIAFKTYEADVYYYDVTVQVNGHTVSIVLPRYHAFLGWIEIFGLPPQNEWVVLDDLPAFHKQGVLEVDGQAITESVTYTPGAQSHTIETIRRQGDVEGVCVWKQDYSRAPESILSEVTFHFPDGSYQATWETEILAADELPATDQAFVSKIREAHGMYDVVIRKKFQAAGTPPPLYYSLFPIRDLVDLTQATGSIIEVGYTHTDSPHKIDRVHGAWYKKFDLGAATFYINETNYTSCQIETERGPEQIKNTYRKELCIDE